jgi:hypothetical protein
LSHLAKGVQQVLCEVDGQVGLDHNSEHGVAAWHVGEQGEIFAGHLQAGGKWLA